QAARADQPCLRAQGRRQSAYRSRKPQDHGRVDLEAVARRHCERSEAIQNLSVEAVWIASSIRSSQWRTRHATRRAAPALVKIPSRQSIISAISARVTFSAGMKRNVSTCGAL